MMSSLLIYREDLKTVLIEEDGNWVLPRFKEADPEKIKQLIQKKLGFSVVIYGKESENIIVAKRVFGVMKENTKWASLEEVSKIIGISSTKLKKWVEDDIAFSTKKQLLLIKKVLEAFKKEELEIYMWGGWGLDFLVGRMTRPHVDVDTLVWKKDKEKIRKIMEHLGFSVQDKGGKFQNSLGEFQFDNDFIEMVDGGLISGKSSDREGIKWPKETFEKSVPANFEGVHVLVINPKSMYEFLKFKYDYYLNASKISGPVDKTKNDLVELKKYLEKQVLI